MTVQSLAPPGTGRARVLPASIFERRATRAGQPLEPLTAALASGRAFFGEGLITERNLTGSRGMRNLKRKAQAILGAFPAVAIGDRGVVHSIGGTPFISLTLAESSYLVACGLSGARVLSPGVPVQIVTGICLGGTEYLVGWAGEKAYPLTDHNVVLELADGIDTLVPDARPHVYEIDTCARIGSFIAGLASLYGTTRVTVAAHIPDREYELYGLSLYARGLLSAELCDQYRRTVRRRASLISAMLATSIGPGAQVTACSPLSVLDDLDVFNAPPGDLAQLVHAAARRQDQLWADLLAGTRPSFRTLIFASYVYTYLAAAQRSAKQAHQLLFVEDPVETRIYREALSAGDRTGVSLSGVPAFYLHPGAVVTQAAFGSRERVLFHCLDGCAPSTGAAALACYGGPAGRPPAGHDPASP